MKKSHKYAIYISAGVVAFSAALYSLIRPVSYTMRVKTIQWTATVEIEQLKRVHEDGWSYPPADAYDIVKSTRQHGTTTIGTDADGNQIKMPKYDTWYEYDINRWLPSRQVVTAGFNKEPYYGDVVLKNPDPNQDDLGDERESSRYMEFSASGLNGNGGELITIDISRDIWFNLTENDELNYEQSTFGSPKNVRIAE